MTEPHRSATLRYQSPVPFRGGNAMHPPSRWMQLCHALGAPRAARQDGRTPRHGWQRRPSPAPCSSTPLLCVLEVHPWGSWTSPRTRPCFPLREVPCLLAPVPRPTVFAAARRVPAPCLLHTISIRLDRLPAAAIVALAACYALCPCLGVFSACGPTGRPPSASMCSPMAASVRPVHWSDCALDVDGGGRRGGVPVVDSGQYAALPPPRRVASSRALWLVNPNPRGSPSRRRTVLPPPCPEWGPWGTVWPRGELAPALPLSDAPFWRSRVRLWPSLLLRVTCPLLCPHGSSGGGLVVCTRRWWGRGAVVVATRFFLPGPGLVALLPFFLAAFLVLFVCSPRLSPRRKETRWLRRRKQTSSGKKHDACRQPCHPVGAGRVARRRPIPRRVDHATPP